MTLGLALGTAMLLLAVGGPRTAVRSHRVRKGDTLVSLAHRYLERREQAPLIALANHLPPGAHLVPGRILRIPRGRRIQVRRGDSLKKIARRVWKTSAMAPCLAAANGLAPTAVLQPGQFLWVPPLLPYEVHPGDELGDIAERFLGQIDYYRLLQACSRLDNPDALERGMTVLIPGGPLAPPPPPALHAEPPRPHHLRPLRVQSPPKSLPPPARPAPSEPARPPQASAASPPTTSAPGALATLDRSERWYEEGEFRRSEKSIEALLQGKGNILGPVDRTRAELLLATDQVALGEDEAARATFRALLRRAPDFRPDPVEVSPTVRRAFEAARGAANQ